LSALFAYLTAAASGVQLTERITIAMRNYVLLLAGVCLLSTPIAASEPQASPAAAAAQDAKAKDAKPKERKEVKVTDKVLKTYVGEYEMGPGRTLAITLENGSLWGQPTDQQKRQLFAESNTKFFLKDLDAQVAFQKDAKGNVVGLVMDQAGRPQRELKKIK
jgi:hypothetical protein